MNKSDIPKVLEPLVNLPMSWIGRAMNMLSIHFGEMQEVSCNDIRKKQPSTRTVGGWALHVQCHWRLCQHGQVKIGFRDFYHGPNDEDIDGDWDKADKSRFDYVTKVLNAEFESNPPIITSITCDDIGGFTLHMNQGYRLEIFIDQSLPSEHWRLFEPGKDDEHYVFEEQEED